MSEEQRKVTEFTTESAPSKDENQGALRRKTVTGIPPSDWGVDRLGEVVQIVSGNAIPKHFQDDSKVGVPAIKISDMNRAGNEKYIYTTQLELEPKELDELNHSQYPAGTVILPKRGAAILTNKRRILSEPSTFDNNIMGLIAHDINPEFLYQISCRIDMGAVTQKGAVNSVTAPIVSALKIPSPPIDEQRKIAAVLYTVDRAIEKTEDVINRLKRVQEGTLRNLFKNGVGEQSETKTTPMGQFPTDWKLKTMESVGSLINGNAFPKEYQGSSEGDYPFIKVSDTNDYRRYVSGAQNYISQEIAEKIGCNIHPEGTVILPKRGAAIMTNKRRILAQDSVIDNNQIGIVGEEVKPLFLYYYLSDVDMGRFVQEGAVKSLTKSLLSKIRIPVPPINTQSKIITILESVDKQIETEKRVKTQQERLKRGIIQDLLSGKVRTNDTNIEVPEEITKYQYITKPVS